MNYSRLSRLDIKGSIGETLYIKFLAKDVVIKDNKNGKDKYLEFTMNDKDITYKCKRWNSVGGEIEAGKVYRGAVQIKEWNGNIDCSITADDVLSENPSEYLNWIGGQEEAVNVIKRALGCISQSIYKELVYNLIVNEWSGFVIGAAASWYHHNGLGGLLVHTAEVVEQCEVLYSLWSKKYKYLDKALLLSGALLHDLYKVRELSTSNTTGEIKYTMRGSLETHITIGVEQLALEAYKLGFAEEREDKTVEQLEKEMEALSVLKHMIIAHHGKREFEAPREPAIPEAMILHIADQLSAYMYDTNRTLKDTKDGEYNKTKNVYRRKGIEV
jgi:HD-superfamily hydrolase